MPNPLIKMGQAIQSKKPQERPEPIAPIVENHAGVNNPWRGIEDHGVPSENEPSPPGTDADTKVGIHYAPIPLDTPPIPVVIVQQSGRELRRSRVHKMSVNGAKTQHFIGRNESRISVTISNPDAALSLYVGVTQSMNIGLNGYELKAGKEITLVTEDEIWVIGAAVDPAVQTVQALEQYVIQE